LLNAALVFRPHVPPVKEAKAWRPFLETVLEALADRSGTSPPILVLWGRIAQWLEDLPACSRFPKSVAEHPYNLSFIQNKAMQDLFGPMHLLRSKHFN
jgi:uracil-DNA glycosylase